MKESETVVLVARNVFHKYEGRGRMSWKDLVWDAENGTKGLRFGVRGTSDEGVLNTAVFREGEHGTADLVFMNWS